MPCHTLILSKHELQYMDHWDWLGIAMDTETLPACSAVLWNAQFILCKMGEFKC